MKNVFSLLCFSLFLLLGTPQNLSACIGVTIDGPSGRCAVEPNTPITYTGSHNMPTTGCTLYEWTIEGGTITAVDGVDLNTGVTDGQKLCVTENLLGCGPGNPTDCFEHVEDLSVGGGGGSEITVVWRPNEKGKLKLKVKEKVKIKVNGQEVATYFTGSEEIEVDLSLPKIATLGASPNNNYSTKFTANLDNNLCDGQEIRWRLNGAEVGTGNPRDFNVGGCASGTVCAYTRQVVDGVVYESPQKCRTYTGSNFIGNVAGTTQTNVNGFGDFFMTANQPITSYSWNIWPSSGVNIFGGTNSPSLIATFTNAGFYDVCATVTSGCGGTHSSCLSLEVSSGGLGGMFLNAPDSDETMNSATGEKSRTDPISGGMPQNAAVEMDQEAEVFAIQPSLVRVGQEINVSLPLSDAETQLLVTNIQGQQVLQLQAEGGQVTIPTDNLFSGVYILTARTKTWQKAIRFVVQ